MSTLAPMPRPTARAAAVAAVEALLAVALVVVAVRWWHRGIVAVEGGRAELFLVDGRWWAGAVLLVTVAGLALIDAARRIVLPTRTGAADGDFVVPETDLTASPGRDHH